MEEDVLERAKRKMVLEYASKFVERKCMCKLIEGSLVYDVHSHQPNEHFSSAS